MSDSTDIIPVPSNASEDEAYKLTRVRLAELMEVHTGDKGQALDLLERWERGVWAGVLLAAPSASEARRAFSMAARAFLGES